MSNASFRSRLVLAAMPVALVPVAGAASETAAGLGLELAVTSNLAGEQEGLDRRLDRLENTLNELLRRLDSHEEVLTEEEAEEIKAAVRILEERTREGRARGFGEVPPEILLAERPQGFMAGTTEVIFGGYLKIDAGVSAFTGGDVPSNALVRDFYVPSLVPVGDGDGNAVFDFNPRETRFFFGLKNNIGGHDVAGKIEFDFLVTGQPFEDERVSNSFVPRMRHAFVTVDNWLFGQTWSTFQDVVALPDNLDFIGPTEGTVFNRQPMIRYTRGPWQVALEQPETLITTETGGRAVPEGQDPLPDLVLRYNHKGAFGHLTLAGIARMLTATDTLTGGDDESGVGWGISGSGLIRVGRRDDLRFMATYGDGVGRYIGVNIVNDAALSPDGGLETIATLSGFAAYRHYWTEDLRSTVTAGYFKADNPVTLTSGAVTDNVYSLHANLVYAVTRDVEIGAEIIRAERETEAGLDGAMNRLLFSAKYAF